jgi:protein-tyrosine phosphatase
MSEIPAGSLVIRTASPDEADLVLGLLRSANSARAAPGTGWGSAFPDVLGDLPEGLVHLGWIGDCAVGTFVLRWSDEQVWGPGDGDGGYVHRLATHPDAAGQGIGRRLVDAADELTARQGRHWLRLDCERGNPRLRAYYEALGFRYVRDEQVPRVARPGNRSASLYERPVTAVP